jgi:hypothetical protein
METNEPMVRALSCDLDDKRTFEAWKDGDEIILRFTNNNNPEPVHVVRLSIEAATITAEAILRIQEGELN